MSARSWFLRRFFGRLRSPARPRPMRREGVSNAAMIGRMESLEQRALLAAAVTNVVQVNVSQNSVALFDLFSQNAPAGDVVDINYTGSQMTLTAKDGTQLNVNGSTKTTYTINTTAPLRLTVALNAPSNAVTVTGDGLASLAALDVRFGNARSDNSLTLNKVLVDSVSIAGRRSNTSVAIQDSTINGPFRAMLGRRSTGSLTIDQTTISGPVRADAQEITVNQSTFDGRVAASQGGNAGTFTTTASTYNQAVGIVQGPNGVVNVAASPDGPNTFRGPQVLKGRPNNPGTLNVATDGAVNDVTPQLIHVQMQDVTPPTAPTVVSTTTGAAPAAVTGAWDSAHAQSLKVTVGSKTFVLGTDSQLTSPSAGKWSLSLSGVSLPLGATTVTARNTDALGNSTQGTGTITLTTDPAQLASIQTFLKANQLTATQTASGLNYVIVTNGSGAVPTSGKSLTVNYSGFLLNADGTLGTEFDSNVDPKFRHVQPFTFTLGRGQVIAGWDEAFALLPVGTVAKLLIPSALAYGASGTTNIPPNSILEFDVTLVSAK